MARTREEIENEIAKLREKLSKNRLEFLNRWEEVFNKEWNRVCSVFSSDRAGSDATYMADNDGTVKWLKGEQNELKRKIESLERQLITAPTGTPSSEPTAPLAQPPRQQKPIPAGANAESLTKRGRLFLEDAEWEKAKEYFDNALDIDPEYAPAYIGFLCVDLKIKSEEELENQKEPLNDKPNFKKAIRFADEDYRVKLEQYNSAIQERKERERIAAQEKRQEEENERMRVEKERQQKYFQLCKEKKQLEAKTNPNPEDFYKLASQFRTIRSQGKSDILLYGIMPETLAWECDHAAERQEKRQEKRQKYAKLLEEKKQLETKTNPNSGEFYILAEKFRLMIDYRDCRELAEECGKTSKQIEEQQRKRDEEEQRKREEEAAAEFLRKEEQRKREEERRQKENACYFEKLYQRKGLTLAEMAEDMRQPWWAEMRLLSAHKAEDMGQTWWAKMAEYEKNATFGLTLEKIEYEKNFPYWRTMMGLQYQVEIIRSSPTYNDLLSLEENEYNSLIDSLNIMKEYIERIAEDEDCIRDLGCTWVRDLIRLIEQFREFGDYKDSMLLAEKCEKLVKEAKRNVGNWRKKQLLCDICYYCGGKIGMFKKCKFCGKKN